MSKRLFIILGFISFTLHLFIASLPIAFWLDIETFKNWTIAAVKNGIWNFYGNTTCNYPPAAMYALWIWGKLYQWLLDPSLTSINTIKFITWLKVLPIIMEFACAALIYNIVRTKADQKSANRATLLYLFNPAVFFVSAVWGQLDSLLIFGLLLTSWYLLEKNLFYFCLTMTVTILIKPQGVFLLPLFVIVYYRRLNLRDILRLILGSFSSLILAWAIILPTVPDKVWEISILWQPFAFIYNKMHATGSSYPHSTTSAFNIWAFTGPWLPDSRQLFGVPHWLIGIGIVGSIIIYLSYCLNKYLTRITPFSYYISAAILLMSTFLFATRMHERYILPALAFLAITAGLNRRLEKLYFTYSITGFINIIVCFSPNIPSMKWLVKVIEPLIPLIVLINIGLFCVLLSYFKKEVSGSTISNSEKSELGHQ